MTSEQTMMLVMTISLAVIALSFIAIGIGVIRALGPLKKAADDVQAVSDAARVSLQKADGAVQEFRDDVVPHLRRVAMRFEELGDRTAQLSSAVLDEVEGPVRTAVAMVSGVRTGTNALIQAITRRYRGSHNGG